MQNFLQHFFNISSFYTLIILFCLAGIFYFLSRIKRQNWQLIGALVFGVVFACFILTLAGFPTQGLDYFKDSAKLYWLYEVHIWLSFINSLFISFLRLMVIPLIFVGLVYAICNLDKTTKLKWTAIFSFASLMITTAMAAIIGLLLGVAFDLGVGVEAGVTEKSIRGVESFNSMILGFVPNNIIGAANSNNILGVVIFAIFFGFCAYLVGRQENFEQNFNIFKKWLTFIYLVISKMIGVLIKIMPYTIVTMIVDTLLVNGIDSVIEAGLFVILIYISWVLVFVMHSAILGFLGLNPIVYFKKAFKALLMAFVSRSSAGTLPLTINCLEKLGVSRGGATFVGSISTAMGMNGCAGYYAALVCVFMLNALGIPLGFSEGVIIVLLCVITSFGIAGIPGITIMILSILLSGLGLESHFSLLAIILAIDPILDMARTSSNVSGGMIASIVTEKKLGNLEIQKYYS